MVNCDIYKRELSPTSKLISSRSYLSIIGMVFEKKFEDIIYLSNNISSFIYFNSKDQYSCKPLYEIYFGLQYQIKNTSNSLVHILKNEKHINKLAFTISPSEVNNGYGKVYFGDFPAHLSNKYPYSKSIPVQDKANKWESEKSTIRVGNMEYNEKLHLFFNPLNNYTLFPSRFLEFIQKNYLSLTTCTENTTCPCDEIKKLPLIMVYVNETTFPIAPNYLFSEKEGQCQVTFRKNFQWDEISLGSFALRNVVTHYDYESHSITLFFDKKYDNIVSPLISLFTIGAAGMFLNIIAVLFYLKKKDRALPITQ